ncbi:hypothetical protein BKA61DRAFT_693862 [Leptodontidium sp. MPI-SDFR-AT-0119]|nr:hypothetical protein BKA61DRAFT_693862 [Leptodontidium sp. MPI-SDFR-AT-0119]
MHHYFYLNFTSCIDTSQQHLLSFESKLLFPSLCLLLLINTQAFKDLFQSWLQDSLAFRTDPLRPGSLWEKREIGTFQILRCPSEREVPVPLRPYICEATAWVGKCQDIRSAIELLGRNLRNLTHYELAHSAGKFAPFFTLLAQVLETPIFSDPRRELRSQIAESSANPAGSVISSSSPLPPSLPSVPSSPIQPPSKKIRQHRSSDSYIPSDQSDQSSFNHRTKSEMTTNACIYELLRCVTELLRGGDEPPVYLEWSITHDTFIVEAGKLTYSTTNDGSLVHKAHRDGYWQRASKYSYCSIEAKSWHDVDEKPSKVQAQEAAHLVGMYSQYTSDGKALEHDMDLLLVSTA